MKFIACFLFLAVFALSGCAPSHSSAPLVSETGLTEEAESPVPSRETVYLYGNKNSPSRFTLSLAGEPRLLPSGYARLAGLVSGQRWTACVEIGGRGLALGEGEGFDDYRIVRIGGDYVALEKK